MKRHSRPAFFLGRSPDEREDRLRRYLQQISRTLGVANYDVPHWGLLGAQGPHLPLSGQGERGSLLRGPTSVHRGEVRVQSELDAVIAARSRLRPIDLALALRVGHGELKLQYCS